MTPLNSRKELMNEKNKYLYINLAGIDPQDYEKLDNKNKFFVNHFCYIYFYMDYHTLSLKDITEDSLDSDTIRDSKNTLRLLQIMENNKDGLALIIKALSRN
jgi:hypothetical protein